MDPCFFTVYGTINRIGNYSFVKDSSVVVIRCQPGNANRMYHLAKWAARHAKKRIVQFFSRQFEDEAKGNDVLVLCSSSGRVLILCQNW